VEQASLAGDRIMVVAVLQIIGRRAHGTCSVGVALLEQVGSICPGSGRLAASLLEPLARRAATSSGAARTGQEEAQPEYGYRPDHDAVKEQPARGTIDVVPEHREPVGDGVHAPLVRQHAGHSDDYCSDQDDETENDDHDNTLLQLMRPKT
jgi:hypothetical protein